MALDAKTRERIKKSIKELDIDRAQAILDDLMERGDIPSSTITDLKNKIAELEDKLAENKPAEEDKDDDTPGKESVKKWNGPLSILN